MLVLLEMGCVVNIVMEPESRDFRVLETEVITCIRDRGKSTPGGVTDLETGV